MSGPGPRLTRRALLRAGGALTLSALGGGSLPGCSPRRDPLDSGPYLQRVSTDRAVVGAITRGPERLVLRWGPRGAAALDQVSEEPEATSFHRLEAHGLLPGGEYTYRLERASGQLVGEATFRAAPAPGGAATFAVLGDSGGTERSRGALIDELDELQAEARGRLDDENQQARVASAVLARPGADLVLHTGDVVYPDGALEDYPQAFFGPFAALVAGRPVVPAVGNHDIKAAGGGAFAGVFLDPGEGPLPDGRARSFEWGDVHFTLLDVVGSAFQPGSAQAAWAEEDLLASPLPWKVAVFHVPPIVGHKPGEYEEVMADLIPLLQRAGVQLALCGHDHIYARWFPLGGVTCVTTGGGGKSLYSILPDPRLAYGESVFHFLEVAVTPRSLELRGIDAAGRVFDHTRLER